MNLVRKKKKWNSNISSLQMKNPKWNYVLIVLIVLAVSLIGSYFTNIGISNGWYDTIKKPTWTPDGKVIGMVWSTIFVLSAIGTMLFWKKIKTSKPESQILIILLLLNAFLNVTWSYLFFVMNNLFLSTAEAGLIAFSTVFIIIKGYQFSKIGSYLFIPYALWVTFATFLNYTIYTLS